jgi:sugar phosphate isomerase/epimerase
MKGQPLTDLSKLCVHTITTKPWNIETAADKFAHAGIKGITVWRDALVDRNLKKTGDLLRANGLEIVSLCRGGFFPSKDKSIRAAAIAENKKAIDEAETLGTRSVVLVCGSEPGQPLEESRKQIMEGINEVLQHAVAANVKLAIEPLHPMYADTRSAINTLRQANDIAEKINSDFVGVAIDVYHLWWDPDLQAEIKRCGEARKIFAFHICDWNVPTNDLLFDRGLMGDGCVNIRQIRGWVEEAGFNGFNEVEIFSNKFWAQDQDDYLKKIISAYKNHS